MSEPVIPGGYIILARKIIDSEIWKKPPLYLKVWVYFLACAQHKDYKNLKRGQLRTSIPEIIEAVSWKVGFRTEKPTKDQIYQILEWLRKGNEGGNESNARATMITTTKATQGLLVNVDNYWFYQLPENYESNDESNDEKVMKPEREQRQPDNINKNDKNDKQNNNDISCSELPSEPVESEPKKRTAKAVKVFDESSPEMMLARKMRMAVLEVLPNSAHTPKSDSLKDMQKWAEDFDKILRLNKVPVDEVERLINFISTDSFWFKNVLSPGKLRDKIDRLRLEMKDNNRPKIIPKHKIAGCNIRPIFDSKSDKFKDFVL